MAREYRLVQWNTFKRRFDAVLLVAICGFVAAHIAAAYAAEPSGAGPTLIQAVLRACGGAAFALLSFILAIGPLARLSPRFLPLLYNRRHIGVACFLVALLHAALVIVWYHGFSDINPLISVLTSNAGYSDPSDFPFEALGLAALIILFLMAATSHDFWNAVLGPRLWKSLHMLVYAAYTLLVAHVLFGAAQSERGGVHLLLTAGSAATLIFLHLTAAWKARARASPVGGDEVEGWLDAGLATEIPDGRAVIVTPATGERIAVFRDGESLHAIANACRHQGGPLGEGRIVDGCVVCPWHGFQYRPTDGCSPAPYTERVPVYPTRLIAGRVYVKPEPLPLGTEAAKPTEAQA